MTAWPTPEGPPPSPMPPPRRQVPPGRVAMMVILAVVVSVVVTVGVVALTGGFSSGPSATQRAVSAPAAPTTTNVPATTTAGLTLSPSQIDSLIAADGHPLDLAAEVPAVHPDAYALIKDDCDTMASQESAASWLAAHFLNASIPGEAAALRLGVPLLCPEFNTAVLQVEGGAH